MRHVEIPARRLRPGDLLLMVDDAGIPVNTGGLVLEVNVTDTRVMFAVVYFAPGHGVVSQHFECAAEREAVTLLNS